jgi:hypothetical protein
LSSNSKPRSSAMRAINGFDLAFIPDRCLNQAWYGSALSRVTLTVLPLGTV